MASNSLLDRLAAALQASRLTIELELPGHVTPFVRVGGERHTPRAKLYHGYKRKAEDDAIALCAEQGIRVPPDAYDMGQWLLMLTFYRRGDMGDGDNLYKAVADVLEGVLYADDRRVKLGAFAVEPVKAKGDERTEVVAVWRGDV